MLFDPKKYLGRPVKQAISSVSEVLNELSSGDKVSREVTALVSAVIWVDGKVSSDEIEEFRRYLSGRYTYNEIEKHLTYLKKPHKFDLKKSLKILSDLTVSEKEKILSALLEIAHSNENCIAEKLNFIQEVSTGLGFSKELVEQLNDDFIQSQIRRENILKSGTGIAVALLILMIFVLTATFLRSVLFGFILAYLFLPLEKWFENKFFKHPFVVNIFAFFNKPLDPLKNLSSRLSKKSESALSPEEAERLKAEAEARRRVSKASNTCVLSVILGGLLFLAAAASLTGTYVFGVSHKIKKWADKEIKQHTERVHNKNLANQETAGVSAKSTEDSQIANDSTDDSKAVVTNSTSTDSPVEGDQSTTYLKSLMAAGVDRLEALKPKIESIPWFNWAKNLLAEYLGNDKNQEELVNLILKKSGGVFSMTAGFFGTLFAIGFDLLLSIFFFSYFLQKMASFNSGGKTGETTGEYIVKSFFDSNWLPKTSLETRKEAREILDNIIMKLKTWVRGYFTIITIESFIYVVGFSLLRIPYSVPLGLIAGCTILLPFIGPLASALLTILVCFAVGGASTSMVTILAIILMYCLMNGIIEQLFLYPAVVGEALGLNTLETIIVVLLGGLFGGIAGMIFAVPAASVLKYLFPKIYQCWRH